jgi:hypothetical protein
MLCWRPCFCTFGVLCGGLTELRFLNSVPIRQYLVSHPTFSTGGGIAGCVVCAGYCFPFRIALVLSYNVVCVCVCVCFRFLYNPLRSKRRMSACVVNKVIREQRPCTAAFWCWHVRKPAGILRVSGGVQCTG